MSRLQFYWSYLTTDPLGFVVYMLYFSAVFLISLTLHEFSHAYVAWLCGDPTARNLGRLTLNPARHLDPVGTVMMLLVGFGYARPVPINPRNFRNGVRDDFLVSIAGILMNLTLFILSCAITIAVNHFLWKPEVLSGVNHVVTLNPFRYQPAYAIMQGRDLSLYAEMLQRPWLAYVQRFFLMLGTTNLSLALFNLLPIPPLDGFHVVNDLLLRGRFRLSPQWHQITQIVLLVLMFSGLISDLLGRACVAVYSGVLNLFLMLTGGA